MFQLKHADCKICRAMSLAEFKSDMTDARFTKDKEIKISINVPECYLVGDKVFDEVVCSNC